MKVLEGVEVIRTRGVSGESFELRLMFSGNRFQAITINKGDSFELVAKDISNLAGAIYYDQELRE